MPERSPHDDDHDEDDKHGEDSSDHPDCEDDDEYGHDNPDRQDDSHGITDDEGGEHHDAEDTDRHSGEPRTDEHTDDADEPTPTQRLGQIREQLEQVSAAPSFGEVGQVADTLADARELAEDEPAVVADLVPEICRTLQRIAGVSFGKGTDVLPGEFIAQCYRDGMEALAVLEPEQLCPDEAADDRVEQVLDVARVVLATDGNLRGKSAALCTIGTLSIVVPERVGDELDAGTVSEQVEWLLSAVDQADRLEQVVRATALLAGHAETAPLVAGVDRSVLVQVDEQVTAERRVWLHVLCEELDHDSPVDPAHVWSELEDEDDPAGICWWLLAGYSADVIPEIDTDDPLVSVLHQTNTEEGVCSVQRLSDRFDFGDMTDPTLVVTLHRDLKHDDPLVSVYAAAGLMDLTGEEWIHSEILQAAIQGFNRALKSDNWYAQFVAARRLGDLVDEGSLSHESRQSAIQAFQTASQQNHPLARMAVVGGLAELAAGEPLSGENRQLAIQALQKNLKHNDGNVRRRAAGGLAELADRESISGENRQSATQALQKDLKHNNSAARVAAARGVSLVSEESPLSECRQSAIQAFQAALQDDDPADGPVRADAAGGLADLAGKESLSSESRQLTIQVLQKCLAHHDVNVQQRAADGLADLAGEESLSSENRQSIIQALQKGLEHHEPLVRKAVVGGLGDLANRELLSGESRQSAIQTLQKDLKHNDSSIRVAAARGVALMGEESLPSECRQSAIQAFQEGLEDYFPIRQTAADGLGELLSVATLSDHQATDATAALLNALGGTDQAVRQAAASSLQTACETHPRVFITDQSLLIDLSARLDPASPGLTSTLLDAIESLAAHDPAILSPITSELKRLLTNDASTEMQVHVLELLSRLGEPTAEPQEGDDD
jgi:HEAT repeat protein